MPAAIATIPCGCGGLPGRAELLTGIEGITVWIPSSTRLARSGSQAAGVGPVVRELRRTTDPLFLQAGINLDER
jgi:hypothetical protein